MRMLALVGTIFMLALTFMFGMNYGSSPSQQEAAVAVAIEATSTPAEEAAISVALVRAEYRVLKVVDGDTIVLDVGGKGTTVRLIGLDTPETSDPRKPVQCFGKGASDKAKELLDGTKVSVETDATQGELDKYGRLLLYVYLPNGKSFNEYMISEGYAHEYTYNLPYKYQTQFKAAEKQARDEKKGLWADDACTASLLLRIKLRKNTVKLRSTSAPPVASVAPANGQYECGANTYNCSSFKTQAEAQAAFDACGGASNDVHKLDNDRDAVVCESLP